MPQPSAREVGVQEVARAEPSRVAKGDVTVVLPVLNEEEGLAAVVDELHGLGYWRILAVDGYSTDRTLEVARRKGVDVIQQTGKGKTGAVRTAIEHVSTPYMLVMDADFTYDARDIERFLDRSGRYDEVVGVRRRENIGRVHMVGNSIITGVFNFLFGVRVSDVCSGMYMLKTSSAKQLELVTEGFDIEVEVLAQVAARGMVGEVAINYRSRLGSRKLAWKDGFTILSTTLNLARVYRRLSLCSLLAGLLPIVGFGMLSWVYSSWATRGLFHGGWAVIGGVSLLGGCVARIIPERSRSEL